MVHVGVLVLAATLLLVAIPPSLQVPVNNYDEEFSFTCPYRQFLSNIASVHNNRKEDRKFDLGCRDLPVSGTPVCYWTPYVNDYDQPLAFQCPYEGFIAGMSSVHHNHHEDRRFMFYCCNLPDTIRPGCIYTPWQNNWDGPFNYQVPVGQILSGMSSYHDNHHEDRRFKFNVCSLSRRTN